MSHSPGLGGTSYPEFLAKHNSNPVGVAAFNVIVFIEMYNGVVGNLGVKDFKK